MRQQYNRMRVRAVALAGVVLLLGSTMTGCDSAEPFDPSAWPLVLSSSPTGDEQDGSYDLYLADFDGNLRLLLEGDLLDSHYNPAWSPDGRQVAFASSRNSGVGRHGMYLIEVESGEVRPLAPYPGSSPLEAVQGDHPAWSPDGRYVAFSYSQSEFYAYDVAVAEVATGEVTLLTDAPGHDWMPTWSPDGSRIAFVSDRDTEGEDTVRELYVMNADGSGQERLTFHGDGEWIYGPPSWAPSGSVIAYLLTDLNAPEREVHLLDVETGEDDVLPIVLPTGEGFSWPLRWSSDGAELLFGAGSDAYTRKLYRYQLSDNQLTPVPLEGARLLGYDWHLATP